MKNIILLLLLILSVYVERVVGFAGLTVLLMFGFGLYVSLPPLFVAPVLLFADLVWGTPFGTSALGFLTLSLINYRIPNQRTRVVLLALFGAAFLLITNNAVHL
ncbi:MAG TPA: hypothetical protein VLH19_05135 [Patescibacteria group bacterium]|nr:hypothetical protein [Patescibacteria group bacterium]